MENKEYWLIPKDIYDKLDAEFKFDCDPCPYPYVKDGIDETEWGKSNWVNPPFLSKDAKNKHTATSFVSKAIAEQKKGKTSVIILPMFALQYRLLEAGATIRLVGKVKWVSGKDKTKTAGSQYYVIFILKGKNNIPAEEKTIAEKIFNDLDRSFVRLKDMDEHPQLDRERAVIIYSDSIEFYRKKYIRSSLAPLHTKDVESPLAGKDIKKSLSLPRGADPTGGRGEGTR